MAEACSAILHFVGARAKSLRPGAAGGLLGLGAGITKNRWLCLAVVCGIAALVLGLFTEWRFFPFKANASLGYFLLHVYQLQGWTLLMIALGGAIGFWVPFRRIEKRN